MTTKAKAYHVNVTNTAATIEFTTSGSKLRVVNRSSTYSETISFTIVGPDKPVVTATSLGDDTFVVPGGTALEVDWPGKARISAIASVASCAGSFMVLP